MNIPKLFARRYAHCLVIHDYNTLYIIGGFRWTEHYTKSMRQYTKTGGWSAGVCWSR